MYLARTLVGLQIPESLHDPKGQDGLEWCKLRSLEGGASPLKVKDANIDKALHTLLNPIWWPAVPEQGWLQQEREVGALPRL